MDIGTRLREARQRQGLTLDDIAAGSKVSPRVLGQIELNRFDLLPGGILTRGHLRAYAAAVGLDGERIVSDYLVQCFGEAGEQLPIARPTAPESRTGAWRPLLFEAVAIALAVVFYASYPRSAESPVPPPSDTDAPAVTPGPPPPPEAVMAVASVSAVEDEGVRLEIWPTGPCWVSATADNRLVLQRLLATGDRAVVTARERLVLRVGDPDTFVYQLNGAPGRRLGPAGKPVTVQITGENYESFVTTAAPAGDPAAAMAT